MQSMPRFLSSSPHVLPAGPAPTISTLIFSIAVNAQNMYKDSASWEKNKINVFLFCFSLGL
jgi:hypothetical protein